MFTHQVSHQFDRKRLLAQWRAGKVTKDSVCDADFLLVTAAKFHGRPARKPCPVCESTEMRVVLWIFGDHLGRMSGTARNMTEIAQLVKEKSECTVHTVEVCPNCRWNHMLEAAIATWENKSDETGKIVQNGNVVR